ncbi:MAG: molecular chaperone TorD family protein [Coriobacteriales bacterium]|jgi:TorA maturation chaperone TorD|nr:molecular chaperone TorD family protein [Coriobacteriales bacterium]
MKEGTMESHTRTLLPARSYAYKALHIIFGQQPTEPILSALFSDASLETLGALVQEDEPSYAGELEAFGTLKEYYLSSEDGAATLKDLGIEYTRLFVGPAALPAPPWEMVYTTGKRELFQPGVLEIRALYQSVGCLPAEAPHVSDDHLAIELDFMRFLCEKCQTALEQYNEDEAASLEHTQRAFLKKHLLVWVPRFLDDVEQATQEPLYIAAGGLLRAFIQLDAGLLQEQT